MENLILKNIQKDFIGEKIIPLSGGVTLIATKEIRSDPHIPLNYYDAFITLTSKYCIPSGGDDSEIPKHIKRYFSKAIYGEILSELRSLRDMVWNVYSIRFEEAQEMDKAISKIEDYCRGD